MAKKSGNKEMLSKVNYSINLIKDIKAGKTFTQEEKTEIWDKYCSTEENNNGYYTPVEMCKFMSDCLDIKEGSRVADLSAGIGNMARPFITEYGKLRDNIIFDLYEYDENTSIALEKSWEDFKQVNVYGCTDTLQVNINNKYDYILGNPPFALKTDYITSWNTDKKGKPKKGLNILEAFIDKIMLSLKEGGTAAIVVASGIAFKGNATALLREHLKQNYNLKLAMQLDSETFEAAGLAGTGVSTLLLIIEKSKTIDNKTIYVELDRDDNFIEQLKSISHYYKIINKQHYIQYNNSNDDLMYGILKEGIDPDIIETKYDYKKDVIGTCYCCNQEIEEHQTSGDYKLKSNGDSVEVCFECSNDKYTYLTKIIPNLLLDNESYDITSNDKNTIKLLEEEYNRKIEQTRLEDIEKNIYIFTNQKRKSVIGDQTNHQLLDMCKEFQNATDDNLVKIKYPFIVNMNKHFDNLFGLQYIDLSVEKLKIEHSKSNDRHVYNGHIKTSCDLYDTSFGIYYYPNDKRCSVYVNYNYICSMKYRMKQLIIDSILPELLGKDIILY